MSSSKKLTVRRISASSRRDLFIKTVFEKCHTLLSKTNDNFLLFFDVIFGDSKSGLIRKQACPEYGCAAFQTWICCNRSFPVLVTSAAFSSLHELDVFPLEMLETRHSSFVRAHKIRNIAVQDLNQGEETGQTNFRINFEKKLPGQEKFVPFAVCFFHLFPVPKFSRDSHSVQGLFSRQIQVGICKIKFDFRPLKY